MKLPDPSPDEIMQRLVQQLPVARTSSDTAITTLGAIATVLVAGIVWNQISPLWLLLAVPLALVSWVSEVKWWKNK